MLFLIRLLTSTGLILSLISLFHYFNMALGLNEGGSFCNINAAFNCDLVNQSKWSVIFGTPLAAYGGAFYVFIFCISFIRDKSLFNRLNLVFSITASIFSLFLFYISEFIIGSLCLMCIGMYIVNFSLLILACYAVKKYMSAEGAGIFQSVRSNFFGLLLSVILSLAYLVNISRVAYAFVMRNNDFYQAWYKQEEVPFKINDTSMLSKDYVKGDIKAPITIVEFSDLECPACRNFYLAVEDMLPAYKNKIRVVFKNFPLDNSCNHLLKREAHLTSCYAAVFARCAGEQNKFWEVIDYIFRLDYSGYAENRRLISEELEKSYSLLGLDEQAIRECIVSGRQMNKIKSDIKEGEILSLESTPSIWINGKKALVYNADALRNIFNGIIQEK